MGITEYFATCFLLLITLVVMGVQLTGASAQLQEQNLLEVKFANNVYESYSVMVNNNEKYTIAQSYSWIRNEYSRYNLISYSLDNDHPVDIPRKARGSFSLDVPMESSHTVTFFATVQYPISVSIDGKDTANNLIQFNPSSPTEDNWFDASTQVEVAVPYYLDQQDQHRKQLVRWAIDTSATKEISTPQNGEFSMPPIIIASPHNIEFFTKDQYYLQIISEHGEVSGDGWYDSGAKALVSIKQVTNFPISYEFDGTDDVHWTKTDSYSTTILMDSPRTIVVKWKADYGQFLIIAIGAIIATVTATIFQRKRGRKKSMSQQTQATIASTSIAARTTTAPNSLVSLPPRQEYEQFEDKRGNSQKAIGDEYARDIMSFAMTKSMEALESLHNSGLVPDSRIDVTRQKLEQSSS